MDASQYKDYVLTLLFLKYVSDRYAGDPYAVIVVPEDCTFEKMVALKGDKEIGDKLNKLIARLAEENELGGVITVADFNNEDKLGRGKEMVDRLSSLIGIFEQLDLSGNRAEGDDLLGDAYEYLMRHFATQSGKSKGQFYTPAEVSRVLAKVVGITPETSQDQTVYDPTCGSGSLLLKVSDEAPRGLSLYGQERDNSTASLAKMNMILHGNPTAEIWQDNTLSSPHWKNSDGTLKTFDYVVANPPFSDKRWSNGVNLTDDEFGRFEYGTPPVKNGDYAYLLHILKSLKSTGKGAVILPHGVLFRGNAEATIRESLLRQGYIKGIIGLPPNLFYGTGIPACIVILDKAGAANRNELFMVDASRGFMKDGNKNRLRSQDIHKIVDVFNKEIELEGYSRKVPLDEIAKNDYNLNIPRYIDGSEPEDIHDLAAHLQGGLPRADVDALQAYWEVFPQMRATLFGPGPREGYVDCKVAPEDVRTTILEHPEFKAFAKSALATFDTWWHSHESRLRNLSNDDEPKRVIYDLSEDLLNRFAEVPLLDKYDIYQLLMNYWAETMQDDVFVITQESWQEGAVVRELLKSKGKSKESPDLVLGKKKYKMDLIPPELVVNRFFAEKNAEMENLRAAWETATQELESFIEEHSGEEGLLEEATTDAGNVTKGALSSRRKELKATPEQGSDGELEAVQQCLKLMKREGEAKKVLGAAESELDKVVLPKYQELTDDEIKDLLVRDKWFITVRQEIESEVERVTQQLADRVKTLEERYSETLPQLEIQTERLTKTVLRHLQGLVEVSA